MAGTTTNGNGNVKWIMGIIASLLVAGLLMAFTGISAKQQSIDVRVNALEQNMTEQRVDIRYIKEAVKEMHDDWRGQWPPVKGD